MVNYFNTFRLFFYSHKIPLLLNPSFVFFLLVVYYFFLPPLIDDLPFSGLVIAILLIGSLSFIAGYNKAPTLHININIDSPICKNIAIIFILIDCYLLINNLISPYVATSGSYANTYLKLTGADVYKIILLQNFYFTSKYIFYAFIFQHKKLFGLAILISMINAFYMDVRMIFLISLLTFAFFLHFHGIFRITKLRLFAVIILLPLLFTFMLIKRVLRYPGVDQQSGDNFFSHFISIIDYISTTSDSGLQTAFIGALESPHSYSDFLYFINNESPYLFENFFRLFFNFIPRDFYPEKPEAISRMVAKITNYDAYSDGAGFTITIFGEGWITFGLLGVIISLFLLGIIGGIAKKILDKNYNNPSNYLFFIAIYPYFIFYIFTQYFRGFFWERLWQCILFLILLYMASFLSRCVWKK
jgi:hypothetical protein